MDTIGNAIERSVIFKLGEAELSKLRMQAVINHQQQEISALKALVVNKDAEIASLKEEVSEPKLPMNGSEYANGSKH